MEEFRPKPWVLENEKLVTDCRVFKVFEKIFRHPDGRKGDFFICESADWVQVAAITKGGKIVLVDQFRMGARRYSWELPGGVMEHGEDPLEAGLRELEEETGYRGENPRLIATFSPNPAMMSNKAHLVLLENCEKTADTAWDANEEIAVREVPLDELFGMIESGEIHHSIAVNGALFTQKYLDKSKGL